MSDEIYQQRQCQRCLDYFQTNHDLRVHLEEHRSEDDRLNAAARHLLEEIDNKLAQLKISQDDPPIDTVNNERNNNGHPQRSIGKTGRLNRSCPHEKCEELKQFTRRQQLRRHFRLHVECLEVCVYCFKLFREVAAFLQHVSSHKEEDRIKDTYISQVCDALRARADKELDRLEDESQPNDAVHPAMKRALEEMGVEGDEGTEARRIKMATDLSRPQDLDSITEPSTAGVDITEHAAVASFLGLNGATLHSAAPPVADIFGLITYPEIGDEYFEGQPANS